MFIAAVQLGQMSFSVLQMADGKSVNVSSVDGLYIHVCVHVCMYVYLFSSALIVSKNTIYCSCFYKLLLYKAQKVLVQ